jgi:hypothetical protein
MHRRDFLVDSAALAAAGALWMLLKTPLAGAADSHPAADPLLDVLCNLVIPETDTPGAKSVGVARFMSLAMAHGLAGTTMDDRAALDLLLRGAAGGANFLSLPHAKQVEVLHGVDRAGYAERGSLWARMKTLVLIGYYTSEAGATKELRYQLVPGRYDPDLPQKPGDHASSNDWTGQRF